MSDVEEVPRLPTTDSTWEWECRCGTNVWLHRFTLPDTSAPVVVHLNSAHYFLSEACADRVDWRNSYLRKDENSGLTDSERPF